MRGKNLFGIGLLLVLLLSLAPVNIGFTSPETVIFVSPKETPADTGKTFTIEIYIMDARDVHGWEVKLGWDVTLTEFPPEVTEGDFLLNFGDTAGVWVRGDYAGGYIQITNNIDGTETAEGEGTLCYVTFMVKDSGISNLTLFDTKLWDYDLNVLPHTAESGLFYTRQPYVTWTVTPSNPLPGEVVTFNASESYDPDNEFEADPGPLVEFIWDFGDGTDLEYGEVVTHVFEDYRFDPYEVTLTIKDDDGDVWSKTIPLWIWRDLILSDVWPSIDWLDTIAVDLFHGQLNPYEAYPIMLIIVTVTNFGTQTEKVTVDLYADLDTSVIGDEFHLFPGTRTLTMAPMTGSGWALWYLWDIRAPGQGAAGGWAGAQMINPLVTDPGKYYLTAVVTPETPDANPGNEVLAVPVYLHARAEPSDVRVTTRNFRISVQGDTFTFSGKVKNMEPQSGPTEGAWARLAFDVIAPDGTIYTFRTPAVWVLNEEKSDWLSVSWTGLTPDDVGTYQCIAYTEFGWKEGEDFFPFVGTEPYAFSFDILP